MAEQIHDQADGLRRLLMPDFVRVITVTSGSASAGKTTTVISLASALAHDGKKVLVIDENIGASNVCATLGLNAHRDLLDVDARVRNVACRVGQYGRLRRSRGSGSERRREHQCPDTSNSPK